MKKIIFAILFVLPALALRADGRGEEILRRMATSFASYNSYKIEFSATMAGEFTALPGTLIVSGEKYYLDVYDSEIFFDGKDGYTYSESNGEVIIETPDPDDYRLFANPARIFQVYGRDYSPTFKSNTTLNGKSVAVLELTPKSAASGYSTLTLYANALDGMPVRMVYRLEEYGNDLVLDITKITLGAHVTPETFVFDPAQYPDVEIIDFR